MIFLKHLIALQIFIKMAEAREEMNKSFEGFEEEDEDREEATGQNEVTGGEFGANRMFSKVVK